MLRADGGDELVERAGERLLGQIGRKGNGHAITSSFIER